MNQSFYSYPEAPLIAINEKINKRSERLTILCISQLLIYKGLNRKTEYNAKTRSLVA